MAPKLFHPRPRYRPNKVQRLLATHYKQDDEAALDWLLGRKRQRPSAESGSSEPRDSDERNQRKIAELTNRIKDLKARLAKEEAALAELMNPPSEEGNKPGKDGNNPNKNGDEPEKDPKKPSKSDKPLGTPTTGALPSTESPAPVGGTNPTAPGTSTDAPVTTNSLGLAPGNPLTSAQAATLPIAAPGPKV